ncbi:hypothetical protein [Promicromonospora sukumoe]|uniref:hypothetical protein n=1 Tax=Promicromonospora sukumoe TaxID=88382 RepID=UPI00365F66AF
MVDDEPSEHGNGPRSPEKPPWNWGAGAALGIAVGVVFGIVFLTSVGPFGIGIGIALGAGLIPTFAMSMARRPDADKDTSEPDSAR